MTLPATAAATSAAPHLEPPLPRELATLALAQWPDPADPTAPAGPMLPAIPGFITSSFSPLVVEVAQRCLRRYFGAPPADPARGERTAVVLASSTGDIATAAAIARAVDEGRRVPPLLFFQSNPNAVVGYLTSRWGLSGPVACTIPLGDAMADARRSASLLISGGDADAALIIVADQARTAGEEDHGVALLVGPSSWPQGAGPSAELNPTTAGSA